MTDREQLPPCPNCGRVLHTGEARVVLAFTPAELERLIRDSLDLATRGRLLAALALVCPEHADALIAELT